MKLLLTNFIIAFIWAAVTGNFSFASLTIGFFLGYAVLHIAGPVIDTDGYTKKFRLVIGLFFYFLKELFVSSIRVAIDVIRPGEFKMHSGVVGVPLDVKSDFQITFLANMISLTPGTLSLDVSEDHKTLFIHCMYIDNDDPDAVRREIKSGMEKKVINTLVNQAEK